MPTFTYDNSAASNSGVILLEVPDVAWFKDSVMSAIAEMTVPENWFGDDLDYEKYAVLQANLMMATYKVLNFNPFPVGMVIQWPMDDVPPGYLFCDGSYYSKTEYPELYAVLGGYYDETDATFAVPAYTTALLSGYDSTNPVGAFIGDNHRYIGIENLPSHTHEDSGHNHSIPLTTNGLAVSPGELPVSVPVPIITDSTGISYASIQNTGGGEFLDVQNFSIVVKFCIYAGR